jgi:hypothetical protein
MPYKSHQHFAQLCFCEGEMEIFALGHQKPKTRVITNLLV